MSKDIRLNITYTEKDIKKFITYLNNHISKLWLCFITIAIPIAGILLYDVFYGSDTFNNVMAFIFALCLYLFYQKFYAKPINQYINCYIGIIKTREIIFSNDNVKLNNEEAQSTCSWSLYKKALDIPEFFILIDKNNFSHIIPKRCFDNEADIALLKELISQKIKTFKVYK